MTVEVEIENRSRWQVDADAVRGTVADALAAEGVTAGEVGWRSSSPTRWPS